MLDAGVYESTMHEYSFQMHYTHVAITRQWPNLKIVEATHYRYLHFAKKDGSSQWIDLDSLGDSYGLLVFDGKKKSIPVDMTNAETQISFYLK